MWGFIVNNGKIFMYIFCIILFLYLGNSCGVEGCGFEFYEFIEGVCGFLGNLIKKCKRVIEILK